MCLKNRPLKRKSDMIKPPRERTILKAMVKREKVDPELKKADQRLTR